MDSSDIDSLYDRQFRTYGKEASKLIQSGSVCIIGLKNGYASEICKNLALSGIKKIILIGDEVIDENDKLNCMFYRKASIGSYCWEAIKYNINIINSNIIIENNNNNIMHNAIIIIINKTLEEATEINKLAHLNNCKTVYMVSGGLAGSIFVDANINHKVFDTTGETKEMVPIKEIKIDNNTSHIICGKHNFTFGDKVKFINLKGNNLEYYADNIFTVIDCNNYSIHINNNNAMHIINNDFKFINGSLIYVEKETIFNHKTIDETIYTDIFKSLNMMINNHDSDYEEQNQQFIIIKEIKESFKYTFAPVISIMGGFVSNEVIKLITNKYTPISQWFDWSDFEIINNSINNMQSIIYDNFNKCNILIVGCGALGCEWLKNLALMGNPHISIVDPDHIEKSNLSRQFLFRNSHIGKSKCLTAIETINNMFDLKHNMIGYDKKLTSEDVEGTNKLFKDKHIIISALDNIEARRYVDTICFDKCLPLFESGTMGMKCNTQPIIPYITETYGNSSDNNDDNQFPVCTIKNFPNSIQHTIHWARDYFEQFNRGPTNCNNYYHINSDNDEKSYLSSLSSFDKNQAIEDINYFLTDIPTDIMGCILKAKLMFEELFIINIQQLLHTFPTDHTLDGQLFWSHGKLCPKPYEYFCIDFINATTHIFCKIYDINYTLSKDDLVSIIKDLKFSNYEIKDIVIAKNDDNALQLKQQNSIIKEVTLNTNINTNININKKLIPLEFEKDDNIHIEWITCASNCRATNYSINTVSSYETKGIAGKIIPAVATTTSTIVGLIAIELLKYLNGINKIDKYRSWYLNMADNTIIYSEPNAIKPIIINNKSLNGWTKFKYNKDTVLNEFIEYYNKLFDVEIEMILYGSAIVYADFMDIHNNTKLSDIFLKNFDINIFENEIVLTLMSSIEIPNINILLTT
jgi:ubiquitin-activating enzyme E1